MRVFIGCVMAMCLVATASAQTSPDEAPSATRPAPRARVSDPIRDAIATLHREAVAAAERGQPFPRTEPSYFAPGADVPQASLIRAIAAKQNADPRVDAYVKLQLLSGVERFDEANTLPAINAYVLGSPALVPGSFVGGDGRRRWEQRTGQISRGEDVKDANEAFGREVSAMEQANRLMVAYRDALRSRIEAGPTHHTRWFAAQLEDLNQRSLAGLDADKELGDLIKEIESWAKSARRAEVLQMARAVNDYIPRRPPLPILTKMSWSEKTRKARWLSRDATLDPGKLEKLASTLRKTAEDLAT